MGRVEHPMMQANHPLDTRLPEMLRSGRRLRGIFNALPSPGLVEMCGYAGFDFVIIDNEHGSANLETTENMLRAARASGIVPVVRCLRQDISRILYMGASSAFSPRAAGYGAFPGHEHTRRSNEGIALIAMIETPEGVEQAAEIGAVEGLDAVFVGPNDLAHAMGFGSDWKAPEVMAAMERALRAVAGAGACPGVLALTPEDEERFGAWGARFFATVTTAVITQALRQAATQGRPESAAVDLRY